MTVKQAIDEIDLLLPNQYSSEQKLSWLSEIDGLIQSEIIAPMSHSAPAAFFYTQDDSDTALLVPEPYNGIYRCWLEMQIHRANMESEKYNGSAALFSSAYLTFAESYVRSCEPSCGVKYFTV